MKTKTAKTAKTAKKYNKKMITLIMEIQFIGNHIAPF